MKIKQAINALDRLVKGEKVDVPATAELVLVIDNGSNTHGYYFVDHGSKSLFWPQKHEELLHDIFERVPATEKSHISASARYYI